MANQDRNQGQGMGGQGGTGSQGGMGQGGAAGGQGGQGSDTLSGVENLNGSITTYTKNVKRWNGGSMILRWVATALDHSQPRFRAVRGFSELANLRAALDREVATSTKTGEEKAA